MGIDPGSETTTTEARAIIEELARRKGTFTHAFKLQAEEEARNGRNGMLQAIEGSEEIREDLAKALKIISTDLYTSRARFLMEVIQNADDNKYAEGVTPTLSITVTPECVKIGCNEDGFSRENIQALCRTGRSSKRPGQGYTGEKGIGFKSVFKLANRVHIRSPPYYFQLDQTRQLGMITPQWDEDYFDHHEEENQTTIVLDRICDESTDFSTALKSDVDAIDPVLILFLRRIERFHITLFKFFNPIWGNQPVISKSFRRVNWMPDSGIVSIKDENANTMRHLYKHRSTINYEGTETRRLNIKETDIVLAFPVKKESGMYIPSIQKQNFAFAYLPLGDFGFKFVIQADFLTTSNRQSIDEDNYWNKNIADAIPHAFEETIYKFNSCIWNSELKELAKTWPLYLSHDTYLCSAYWRNIAKNINEHLSRAAILKNRAGGIWGFNPPKRLMFLDWAQDRNGKPMFGQLSDYVSDDYPESVREALMSLGVKAPGWKWLCDRIQELHSKYMLSIKMQSKEWCSDLAKVILEPQEPRGDNKYARDMKDIPLIPLANGTWKCPPSEDNPIYFPASSGTVIPPGLPLSLVDEGACACPKRRKLFRLLGVKDCDVPNVIKQILDYHSKLGFLLHSHAIAQLKYLYKMRQHLRPGDMELVYFQCSASEPLLKGSAVYADISVGGELKQLFSGFSDAHFLNSDYFAQLDPSERSELAEWLNDTANVALAPRLISSTSHGLHEDFEWLLSNRHDQVLAILHQHWGFYKKCMTSTVKDTLADHKFVCKSGDRIALRKTYLPFPKLLEKTQEFGHAEYCNFLVLPSGDPNDWTFLCSLGVGRDEGLDFYLWMLSQPGFMRHKDINRSKQLYLAIQSRALSPAEELMVRNAFGNHCINLPNRNCMFLAGCVWQGPKGFFSSWPPLRPVYGSVWQRPKGFSKPALCPVYGHELDRLFRKILKVPNATSAQVLEYLEQLRHDETTTMTDVAEAYMFLQSHYADSFSVNNHTVCIAVPSLAGSALEWKTPSQCVWDDEEFSENGLELECKTAIRHTVEQHAPAAKAFFIDVLKLPNAGVDELLADLALMQKEHRDDPERVHRLYERIASCRRRWPNAIRNAFKSTPLVFLRGINDQRGRWLSLEDCIWTRSVLRNKHALMPSLNDYRDLFRFTLEVPNATTDMLVTDLLESLTDCPMDDKGDYQYVKELLQEIARLWQENQELERLYDIACWPCHAPFCPRELCSIGSFYVNDRQDLFDIFSDSGTFLDFDFDTSKSLSDLLRDLGCDSFLSDQVVISTESREPLDYNRELTEEFRGRADALVKYFEHVECESSYELRHLLKNATVWISANIMTHYTLGDTTVTRTEGGSSVKVSLGEDDTAKLEIFFSANKQSRDCALIVDFPEQLVAALKLEPTDLPDLSSLLSVPLASLKALLIKKGITGGDAADDNEEILVTDPVNEESRSQSGDSSDNSGDDLWMTSRSDVRSDFESSTIVQYAHASARSEAANTTSQPYMHRRTSTPQVHLQHHVNVSSDESLHDLSLTPRPPAAGLYSAINRNRNKTRMESFARNADPASSSRREGFIFQFGGGGGMYDMTTMWDALDADDSAPTSAPIQVNVSPRRRANLIKNRNKEEVARDFEVGFLGEQFVYTLLRDTLKLPDFTGEDNWTSSLRSRAGFSTFSGEVSDFTYEDKQGALTRYFLRMQHPYPTPEWLLTACENGNVPLYRLEVKSTTSQDPTTAFYMSGVQHGLAKKLRITSATPSEVYVVLRISGLDALEDGAKHRPQWRAYLDPYTRGEEGVLNFSVPTFAVTARR